MVFGRKLRLSREDLGNYGLERYKKEYPDVDIDSVIDIFRDVVDSGIYQRFIDVHQNWEEPVPLDSYQTTEIALESRLLTIAYDNLQKKPNMFSSYPINYQQFYYFYPFLEWVYSLYLGRQLTEEDVRKIFKSRIGEKIVFNLEKFDQNEETALPTPEFFQKLSKLKWKDKKAQKLNSKIEELVRFFGYEKFEFKKGFLDTKQNILILFFIGCSAIKNERDVMVVEDVLTAYKTLFKIIQTDLTKLINGETQPEPEQIMDK